MAVTFRGSATLVNPGSSDDPAGTIASYTPAVGSVLVLLILCDTGTGITPTVTLGGTDTETWTLRASRGDSEGTAGIVYIYTCTVGTSGGRTTSVLVNNVNGGAAMTTANRGVAAIFEKDDPHASPIGNVAEGSFTTDPATPAGPTTANANADVFAVCSEWNAAGAMTSSDLTETGFHTAGIISGLYGYKSVASAGATTINFNAAGTPDANWAAIAIETAGGGGGGAVASRLLFLGVG